MKRSLTAFAVLMFLTAAPAFALDQPQRDENAVPQDRDRTSVIDDVIRMTKAGVDDDAIIKFVHESKNLYVVDADVIIALTDAKVSKAVLTAVMDEAYDRGNGRDDDRRYSGRRTRTVYVRPYYAYSPYYYPYGYDPYFFGPHIGFGFGFGGYRGGFGGYHGGGGHHGGGNHGGGGHHGGRH